MNESNLITTRTFLKLYQDLGETILHALQDSDVDEILLNPNGSLWLDRASSGLQQISYLSPNQAYAIIHSVAGIRGLVVNEEEPLLESKLPYFKEMKGERFTAQVPPVVSNPSFTIRKTSPVYSLDDYIATGRMSSHQASTLQTLIHDYKNILICGGPESGKTTVTNTLIAEIFKFDPNERLVILEEKSPEIQCKSINQVSMVTRKRCGKARDIDLRELVQTAMRVSPDRILVGEVRGAETLEMLKAWNTGCPGGMCTVHANGAMEAIQRIVDLSMEAGLIHPPITLILQTIDAVVFVTKQGSKKGFLKDILSLRDYQNGKFIFEKLA